MNIDCCVIGDLLPLYADESCSDASRALVDDHLKTLSLIHISSPRDLW